VNRRTTRDTHEKLDAKLDTIRSSGGFPQVDMDVVPLPAEDATPVIPTQSTHDFPPEGENT